MKMRQGRDFCTLAVHCRGALATGFRAVDLDHASAREAAYTEGDVERQTTSWDHADGHQHVAAAQAHDGAFAVRLFDLRYRCIEHFCFVVCHFTPRWRKVGKLYCTTDRWNCAPGKTRSPCWLHNGMRSLPLGL